MRKLALHRETLRMISSDAATRYKNEQGTIFGNRIAKCSEPFICPEMPLSYSCDVRCC